MTDDKKTRLKNVAAMVLLVLWVSSLVVATVFGFLVGGLYASGFGAGLIIGADICAFLACTYYFLTRGHE